jgi:hypothetical protein
VPINGTPEGCDFLPLLLASFLFSSLEIVCGEEVFIQIIKSGRKSGDLCYLEL